MKAGEKLEKLRNRFHREADKLAHGIKPSCKNSPALRDLARKKAYAN